MSAQLIPLRERPPVPVLKDFLGREIALGDEVVIISVVTDGVGHGSHAFERRIVDAFPPSLPQLIRLRHPKWEERHSVRRPEELIVVY